MTLEKSFFSARGVCYLVAHGMQENMGFHTCQLVLYFTIDISVLQRISVSILKDDCKMALTHIN